MDVGLLRDQTKLYDDGRACTDISWGLLFLSIGWRILRFRRIPNLSTCFLFKGVLLSFVKRWASYQPLSSLGRGAVAVILDNVERSSN